MAQGLHGSQWLLSTTQFWLVAGIICLLAVPGVYLGRWAFEGRAYSVSLANKYGDVALALTIMIAAIVIHRDGVIKDWMRGTSFHWVWVGIAIASGIGTLVFQMKSSDPQTLDVIHAVFFVPLMVYLLGTTVPVIFAQGSQLQIITANLLIFAWVILFIVDAATGRLDQRQWLQDHGRW